MCGGDFELLASRYGYIPAHDRETAAAIQADVSWRLAALGATALVLPPSDAAPPTVKWFEPNSPNLVALVECLVPTDTGASVLVELVVVKTSAGEHLYLEDVSPA
jgi:hypothetical protein